MWNTSYSKENGNRGYCGLINIYNFLNDSIKYNRVNDSGYMIGRYLLMLRITLWLRGRDKLGFLYNDIINSVIDKDKMKAIIQSAVLYTLDFDLFIPPYDEVKEVSVLEIQQLSDKQKLKTAKRLGFQFKADSDAMSNCKLKKRLKKIKFHFAIDKNILHLQTKIKRNFKFGPFV